MTMKQLVPINTGGGVKPSPLPSANLNDGGSLVLNSAADKMIGGEKWIVSYEDDAKKPQVIELKPAATTDKSAYSVTRGNGSAAKVTIRSLWQEAGKEHAEAYIGRYTVHKIAHGLKLIKAVD